MRVKDEYKTNKNNNDLVSFDLGQKLNNQVDVGLVYTMLDNVDRDIKIKGNYRDASSNLRIYTSYFVLLNDQGDNALEFNPYQSILRDLHRYQQFRLLASKGWGDNFQLEIGLDKRFLKNGVDEGTYNREYDRYYIIPTFYNLFQKEVSLSLTAEVWDSEGRKFSTYGLDVDHPCGEKLEVSLGTYYSLFKYDIYHNQEDDHVQSYFLKCKYDLKKDFKLKLSYSFEDADEYYHVIKTGLQCLF